MIPRRVFTTASAAAPGGSTRRMSRDPSADRASLHGLHQSTGLVANDIERGGRRRPARYYLATLNELGVYALDRVGSDGPAAMYHYEYAVPGTTKTASVLPMQDRDRAYGYQAQYLGPPGTLVVLKLLPTGDASRTDGQLTLTERPAFILHSDPMARGPGERTTCD